MFKPHLSPLAVLVWLPLCATAAPEFNVFQLQLQDALERYETLQETGGWPAVPAGPSLKSGDASPRLTALRRRLLASGDLSDSEQHSPGDIFDLDMHQALIRFQRRHGLTVDGIVGPATLTALNTPIEGRITQMRANLERMAELALPSDRNTILINIPAFELVWLERQQVAWRARVQVGHPQTPTPSLSSELTQIVVNPSWAVPHSIAIEEILPRVQADPDFLATQNFEVLGSDGFPTEPASIEWASLGPEWFPYKFVQKPCAMNAMGRVKFIFPNAEAIYLHDTPNRDLFEQTRRAFSHGCIRADRPLDLARRLLQSAGWDDEPIRQVLASDESRTIRLPVRPFVAIVYWTAFVDDNGIIQFRDDIYDRDLTPLAGNGNREHHMSHARFGNPL